MNGLPSLDEVTGDEITEILTEVEVETPNGECDSLAEVGSDIVTAHDDLDQYRDGAIAMVQALDEEIIEQEEEGNDGAVSALKEIKHAAFGVYLRVVRGDAEVMGDREGEYSGYLGDEIVGELADD